MELKELVSGAYPEDVKNLRLTVTSSQTGKD